MVYTKVSYSCNDWQGRFGETIRVEVTPDFWFPTIDGPKLVDAMQSLPKDYHKRDHWMRLFEDSVVRDPSILEGNITVSSGVMSVSNYWLFAYVVSDAHNLILVHESRPLGDGTSHRIEVPHIDREWFHFVKPFIRYGIHRSPGKVIKRDHELTIETLLADPSIRRLTKKVLYPNRD